MGRNKLRCEQYTMQSLSCRICFRLIQCWLAFNSEGSNCQQRSLISIHLGKSRATHQHNRHVVERVGFRRHGMLVLPEARVVGHRDTGVLIDCTRQCIAMETMMRPVFLLARMAAIVHVVTSRALGACRHSANSALTDRRLC